MQSNRPGEPLETGERCIGSDATSAAIEVNKIELRDQRSSSNLPLVPPFFFLIPSINVLLEEKADLIKIPRLRTCLIMRAIRECFEDFIIGAAEAV